MLNVDQIEEWLGQEVVDSAGERVGKLDEVFYSSSSGEAVFAAVKSGLLGRRSNVVPLAGASVGRDYVRLAYSTEQIESAGSDVAGTEGIERDDARRLGEAYGVQVAPEDDFEAAGAINQRREAAEEARRQAEALEEEARRRELEAQDARGTAQEADQDAAQKASEAERARAEAEQARAAAEETAPPA